MHLCLGAYYSTTTVHTTSTTQTGTPTEQSKHIIIAMLVLLLQHFDSKYFSISQLIQVTQVT